MIHPNSKVYNHRLSTLEALIMNATHKMNNALSVLKLETEAIMNPAVQKQVDRLADIVQLLQQYSRPVISNTGRFGVNDVVTGAIRLYQLLSSHPASISCRLDAELLDANGDIAQTRQTIIDLICYCVGLQELDGVAMPLVLISTCRDGDDIILTIEKEKAMRSLQLEGVSIKAEDLNGKNDRFHIKMRGISR